MKSKLFLTLLLLAVITTIGISQEKQSQDAKDKAAKAELERISKLPMKVQGLVGVKGIHVYVAKLRPNIKSVSLAVEQVKADVELKLRQAGIKVYSREEYASSEDWPSIDVFIDTIDEDDLHIVPYLISVNFMQNVRILRSPYTTVWGRTWIHNLTDACPAPQFPEEVRKHVKYLIDSFIKDYLKANPKK